MTGVQTCALPIYSKTKEEYYEINLLKQWSEVPLSSINIKNIPISSTRNDTIHYIEITTGTKIPFVLVPGFGASGAMYYKLMKDLSEIYDVYFIDMRGMGW